LCFHALVCPLCTRSETPHAFGTAIVLPHTLGFPVQGTTLALGIQKAICGIVRDISWNGPSQKTSKCGKNISG